MNESTNLRFVNIKIDDSETPRKSRDQNQEFFEPGALHILPRIKRVWFIVYMQLFSTIYDWFNSRAHSTNVTSNWELIFLLFINSTTWTPRLSTRWWSTSSTSNGSCFRTIDRDRLPLVPFWSLWFVKYACHKTTIAGMTFYRSSCSLKSYSDDMKQMESIISPK